MFCIWFVRIMAVFEYSKFIPMQLVHKHETIVEFASETALERNFKMQNRMIP